MKNINNILFLDVETVPICPDFSLLSEHGQKSFKKKFRTQFDAAGAVDQDVYTKNVSVLAEYAKVACISVGVVDKENHLQLRSWCSEDEAYILRSFMGSAMHENVYRLCAHNGKAFDFPFVNRRMMINGLAIPPSIDMRGKKPWDLTSIIDTLDLWSLCDLRYMPSLDRIAYAFGIESPKQGMDGSMVADVFYSKEEMRFEKIATYCEGDVRTLTKVLASMYNLPHPV